MKAMLEFDLNNPEEKKAHMRAIKSLDMALVLFEITANLRKKCESICDGLEADSDKYDGVYVAFEQINSLLQESNINIDELLD